MANDLDNQTYAKKPHDEKPLEPRFQWFDLPENRFDWFGFLAQNALLVCFARSISLVKNVKPIQITVLLRIKWVW